MKINPIILIAALLLFLSACESTPGKVKRETTNDANILATVHNVANALLTKAASGIDAESPLLVASFVDINQLEKSSSFGRIVSQQMASAITSKGYTVKEMLLRNNVYIRHAQGEFLLSRQLRNISNQHNAQAVVVGTYAIGSNNVYATAKIISTESNTIIASHDFVLPLGPDTRTLLNQ